LDVRRFDFLTRQLSDGASRRRVLAGLSSGLLATLTLKMSVDDVSAKKKGKGKGKGSKKRCKSNQKRCRAKCIPKSQCCSDFDCSSFNCGNEFCLGDGTCGCLPGQTKHLGRCGTQPTCKSVLSIVGSAVECCSNQTIQDDGGQLRCAPGTVACLTHFDCVNGSFGSCRGFLCVGSEVNFDCPAAPSP
jgi:hypothetical protein